MITKIYAQRLKKDLMRLAIFSLITVVIWLGLATHRSLTKSQIKPDVQKQLEPLTASLELDTLEQVKSRPETPPIDWILFGPTPLATISAEQNDQSETD
ncbi:hypothetical protein COW80_00745 [Candidatus Beckwithbacteria bacterium CG22_combo_CG10-13_8_21_14_all_01_47_9]|uniref:Uncharacterized protein n=5 Tax=Candidatus Beckwithiibacteriota TaxID=1752726 RepID=A0A2H0E2L6_9BACT|nr:MAG: hypothetical protein AUJ59_00135 [Candidatus Beckwithbacteria bacterium CG1_02_47_37]PIP51926.1 MAG: hypothetical protein COX09_04425 [Candidatus Beckwithbacteria bacterium CG23_combo_of_CG06-09_8_20_14_all_47_9]PIP88378.1 MAG: hypothetical protein COW80_00745 [Candidatus Beckwithbacteria bacterium CG22_combo_CG10-13_8_21_14_all_01_47_9]PJA22949.1 MAG: hypothetical protein COX59_01650 [Candidatus Beckwithbacteria bacterium CG_4_10_14_0_2_um_filter_47_25]PJC66213.1 MAG: hypothetical prot